jgi:hypothetical protein
VLISPKDDYELVRRLAPTISLAEVNHLARQTFCQTLRVADVLRNEDIMASEETAEKDASAPADFSSSLEIIEKSRGISVFVTCPSLYSPDEEAPQAKAKAGKDEDDDEDEDEEDMDEEDGDEEDDEDGDEEDEEEDEDEDESTPEGCQAKHQHKFIHSRTAQLVEKEVKEKQKLEKDGQPERKKLPFHVTKDEIRQVIEGPMEGTSVASASPDDSWSAAADRV